jgi:hypothetical protein
MMKGVMMSAIVSVPATGQGEAAENGAEAGKQVVTSLVNAGKQAFTGPYAVTVRKIEPIAGSNQVRVTLFVTGEDEPAHDFTETGYQVVSALLNVGMRADISGTGSAKVEKIEAVEGGDDDSDDDSDEDSDADALSRLVANADAPSTPPQPTRSDISMASASNGPTPPVSPPISGERPTASAPSQVRQPGTSPGDADGGESGNDGPTEHERPPHVR